jgi:outer membrane protein assembly factor BamB
MCRYRCHGWLFLSVVALLAILPSVFALIQARTPLEGILNDCEYVVVAKVEKIDADRPLVVLTVQEDIKGKLPMRRLAVNFKGDEEAKKLGHVPQLLKRLAPDLPVVLTIMVPRGKDRFAFAYTNGTWFHVMGQPTDEEGKLVWSLMHGEPYLRRTFKGTTAELRQTIIDGISGKGKLPPWNKNEPPGFGPEVAPKESEKSKSSAQGLTGCCTPGVARPEPAKGVIPATPFADSERAAPGVQHSVTRIFALGQTPRGRGPLFGVIPTLGVGAPLLVLAALFPAVFGGVLVLFRQWVAFLTVFSVNSMLLLLHWLLNSYWPGLFRDSWLGTEAGLWFVMTLVALIGVIWAWQRQVVRQSQAEFALDAPRRTELNVLWTLAAVCGLASVLTPLLFWVFVKHYDVRTDLASMAMIVLTLGVLAGALYRVGREYTGTPAPLATEGVMIAGILVGHLGYMAYRWGGDDLGTGREPATVANVAATASGVHAVQPPTIRWQFAPPNFTGLILAAPLVHGDDVWVGAARTTFRQGTLYCLNRADGTRRGEFIGRDSNLKQMISSPVIVDGKLYMGEGFHDDPNCRLFCVDPGERKEVWSFQTGSQTEPTPCIANGKVYFGAGNDGIYCVDAATAAQVIWRFPPKDYTGGLLRCGSSPALVKNRLYAGSAVDRNRPQDPGETAIFCLDADTGSLHWKQPVPLPCWAGPVVRDGRVYYALGNGDVLDDDEKKPAGRLICVDAATGEETWHYDVANGILDKPAVDAEHVYVGCRDGNVYCLDRVDGKLRWKAPLGAPVVASPVIARCPGYAQTAHVFAVSTAGKVACLDPATGEAQWSLPLTDKVAHFSATPTVVATRGEGGDRRQIYVAGAIGELGAGRPIVFCLEDLVKVD